MKIRFKTIISLICSAAALSCFSVVATASASTAPDGYPTRSIEITVPFGPGGGADIFARSMAPLLEKKLGVPIAVVNRPGANTIVGLTHLVNQPADGYSLAIVTNDTLASIAAGVTKLRLDDFVWIARGVADVEMIFARTNETRFTTFDDYVEYAKDKPGQLSMAVGGRGGLETVVAALVNHQVGVSVKYVPYDKPSERFAAFLGGHTDLLLEEPSDMKPYLDDKKVMPLIQMLEVRPAQFPDTPTSVEKGIDVTLGLWRGVIAKEGTAPEIVSYLSAVIKETLAEPSFVESYIKKRVLNIRPGYLDTEDFEALARKEVEEIKKAISLL